MGVDVNIFAEKILRKIKYFGLCSLPIVGIKLLAYWADFHIVLVDRVTGQTTNLL
jgi:hypothetical protein